MNDKTEIGNLLLRCGHFNKKFTGPARQTVMAVLSTKRRKYFLKFNFGPNPGRWPSNKTVECLISIGLFSFCNATACWVAFHSSIVQNILHTFRFYRSSTYNIAIFNKDFVGRFIFEACSNSKLATISILNKDHSTVSSTTNI